MNRNSLAKLGLLLLCTRPHLNRDKSIAGVKSDLTGLEETGVSSTGESGVNMSSSGPISRFNEQI